MVKLDFVANNNPISMQSELLQLPLPGLCFQNRHGGGNKLKAEVKWSTRLQSHLVSPAVGGCTMQQSGQIVNFSPSPILASLTFTGKSLTGLFIPITRELGFWVPTQWRQGTSYRRHYMACCTSAQPKNLFLEMTDDRNINPIPYCTRAVKFS